MIQYIYFKRLLHSVGEREDIMNIFKELFDNIKAEWDLAVASPSPELRASVKRAIDGGDGDLCAEFEDSTSWLGHGRILGDMENAGLTINNPAEDIARVTGWPVDQVKETVEAEKIVLFLRKKMYTDDQIKRIGQIAMSLQRNDGDVNAVIKDVSAVDVDSVNAVIQLMNEYQNLNPVAPAAKPAESKKTTSSRKSPTKKTNESMEKPFTTEAAPAPAQ